MKRRYVGALSFFLAMLALPSFAETLPPEYPFHSINWKATMKAKPSNGMRMGSLYIQFEETTLGEIQRKIGVGQIAHQGDAGGSLYWLCYSTIVSGGVQRVWIGSHGEMGGPDHQVGGVDAVIVPKGEPTKDCPALPSGMQSVSLDHGMWLNTTEGDTRSWLGEPSYRKGHWQSFDYEGKVPNGGGCGPEGFDQSNRLLLQVDKGRVISLHAGQVTSC